MKFSKGMERRAENGCPQNVPQDVPQRGAVPRGRVPTFSALYKIIVMEKNKLFFLS